MSKHKSYEENKIEPVASKHRVSLDDGIMN